MKKMIILDRDGVINEDSDNYIKTPEEWIPIPGSIEAIARLKKAGYLVTIATNQSGIARGFYSEQTLQQMHDKLAKLLAEFDVSIDGIFHCPHVPDDACKCRKPKPGMLLDIARQFEIKLSQTPFVGDTITDIRTARAVNAQAILVLTGKGSKTHQLGREITGVPVFKNLAEYVNQLLQE